MGVHRRPRDTLSAPSTSLAIVAGDVDHQQNSGTHHASGKPSIIWNSAQSAASGPQEAKECIWAPHHPNRSPKKKNAPAPSRCLSVVADRLGTKGVHPEATNGTSSKPCQKQQQCQRACEPNPAHDIESHETETNTLPSSTFSIFKRRRRPSRHRKIAAHP